MDALIGTSGALSKINPALSFDCVVANKTLTATVIGTIDDPLYYAFRVQFSDGHEDDFTFVEGHLECEREVGYAEAIHHDLKILCIYTLNQAYHTMRLAIENKQTNVWVFQDGDDDARYRVCYNGDYRFHMIKAGTGWEAKTSRQNDPEIISNDLVIQIGHMLNYYRGE